MTTTLRVCCAFRDEFSPRHPYAEPWACSTAMHLRHSYCRASHTTAMCFRAGIGRD